MKIKNSTIDDVVHELHRSTSLVKAWSQAQLPNGRMLSESLTLQGLPLWDMVAPDLALYHVPYALSQKRQRLSFTKQARTYISLAKHRALDLIMTRRSSQECAMWPSRPVFLFLGFSPYMYRDVLQPVVTRLSRRKDVSPISLYDGQITASSSNRNGFQDIWHHWNSDVKAQTRAMLKALKATVTELLATGGLSQIIRDQDHDLWPQMKDMFIWLFQIYLPHLLPHVAIAWHILGRHQPVLIISPDVADPRTRVYCLFGRRLGIPSLEIQFGIYGPEAVEWQFFIADHLAAWGEQAREVLIAHGIPAERISLTGSPRHDYLLNISKAEVAKTRTRLSIPEGNDVVLFASICQAKEQDVFVDPEILNSAKRAVFQAAAKVARLYLVVKPHPLEDVRKIKQLSGTQHNIVFADKYNDIRELIKACDAFLTLGSTATIDALIANKLTICPVFPGLAWNHLF